MAKKNEKKIYHVGSRFNRETYEAIREEAFRKKMSMSMYVTTTIADAVNKAKKRREKNANVTDDKRASSSVGESSK